MDLTTAAGSVLAAFGLSGAAGLNAWLPLLLAAVLDRAGAVELAAPFDRLSEPGAIAVLSACFVLDFVGDKIPAIDHALHAVGTVVHPASGAVLFVGPTGAETDLPTLVGVLLGGGTAGAVHAGRALVRPVSSATTAGLGNPVLSAIEDAISLVLAIAALLVPVLAFLAVLALLGAAAVAWRRRRRRPRLSDSARR